MNFNLKFAKQKDESRLQYTIHLPDYSFRKEIIYHSFNSINDKPGQEFIWRTIIKLAAWVLVINIIS